MGNIGFIMKNSKSRKGGIIFSLIKIALVVVVVLAIALYFFTEQIISRGIKSVGTLAGVEMEGSASIVWGDLAFSLNNFHIKNPDGYLKGDAISFKEVFINPDPTLEALKGNEPLVIDEIRISSPFLRLEQAGLSKNNLIDIKNKFSDLSSKYSSKKSAAPAEAKKSKSARKYIIRKIVFEDGSVAFTAGTLNQEAPLPSFTMKDLGGADGAEMTEIVAQVILQLIPQAIDAVKNSTLNSGSTKEFLDNVQKGTNDAIDATRSAIEGIFNLKKNKTQE